MSPTPNTVALHDLMDVVERLFDVECDVEAIRPDMRWPEGDDIAACQRDAVVSVRAFRKAVERYLDDRGAGPGSPLWRDHFPDDGADA
jgi:hypothetical protein